MVPIAKSEVGNGVQNGVQNDGIRLGLRGSGTFGLPAKSMVLTPGKGLELSDSDSRLQLQVALLQLVADTRGGQCQ